jgi:hypothetical protein
MDVSDFGNEFQKRSGGSGDADQCKDAGDRGGNHRKADQQ